MSLRDLPTHIKAVGGVIGSIGVILGAYFGIEGWADTKLAQVKDDIAKQQAVADAKDELIHDRLYQISREQYHESQLKLAELELVTLEEESQYHRSRGQSVPQRVLRGIERLLEKIKYHEAEMRDAQEIMKKIGDTKK
jgi:hypothetical protein